LDFEEGESFRPLILKVENEVSKKRSRPGRDIQDASAVCHFFGEATHDDIISESLDSHFKRDPAFKEWLDNNDLGFPVQQESEQREHLAVKAAAKTA
jgi:hypothetical protein